MAYTKQTWADLPSKTTPINAERLTHIEDGIFNAAATADNAASTAGSLASRVGIAEGKITNLEQQKVDKETGKGLSENDFTNTLKSKLDGIASGAEVNVQSDWDEADSSSDAFILNKPTLGTASTKNSTSVVTSSSDLVESGAVFDVVKGSVGFITTGKNLLENTAINSSVSNVSFTVNADKSITVSGNNPTNNYVGIIVGEKSVSYGDVFVASCGSDALTSDTVRAQIDFYNGSTYISNIFVLNDDTNITVPQNATKVVYRIYVAPNYTIPSPVTIYPMLRETGTSSSYEPYHASVEETLRDAEVIKGKNLVDYILHGCNIDSTGGIAYDGLYTIAVAKVKNGETYAITTDDGNIVYGFFTSKPAPDSRAYNNQRVVTNVIYFTAPIDGYAAFRTSLNYSKPQLEVGTQATAYEPYYVPLKDVVPQKCDNTVIGTVEDGSTASQAYAVGEHFIKDGQFKEVTQAIASGGAISDSNTVDKPIADILKSYFDSLGKLQYKSVSGNAPSIILKSVTRALIVVGQYVYGAFNGNRLMVAIISGGDYNDGNEHKNMTTIIKGNEFDAEVGFSFSISTNGVGEITLSASTNPVFIGVLILG